MKLHLPLVLFAAVLACMAPSQAAFSYLADGVNPADLAHSDRFYDNGKGLYWSYQYDKLYSRAKGVYTTAGWTAFGKLYDRLVRTSGFSTQAFTHLTDDGNTCGYQVPVNMMQYWQSYYGVFYKGSEELPYGFNYSREYLDAFGGTQSLELGMLFYDYWQNAGNNVQYTSLWYLKGETHRLMRNPAAGGGGYFADYYEGYDTCHYHNDVNTLSQLKEALVHSFALQQQADGSYVSTEAGRLMYVGLSSPTISGGHAITCYGFDLDNAGNVVSMKMVNSDDLEYKLFTVYVKLYDGHLYLYNDAACTDPWKYAGGSWYLNDLAHLITPDILKQMYAVYSDAETPLTWNGEGSKWAAATTVTNDALPTAATGWDVRIGSDAYHSYYYADRPVQFDDTAVNGNVAVSGTVSVPAMMLANTALDYTFTGSSSANIKAPQLPISGGGAATFKNLTLTTGRLDYSNYALTFGSGATLKADACTVGAGATLELAGGKAAVTALTLGNGGTLAVTAAGSTITSSVTMDAGSELYLVLGSKQTSASLFSVSGSLTLSGAVGLEIGGASLVNGSTYMLCSVSSGSVDVSKLSSAYGDLSFSNKVLYLTYYALPSLAWTSGSGTWSGTQWQGVAGDTDHADVSFASGSGTVTVSGAVKPHSLTMSGGSYTLSGSGASVAVDRDVKLSGSAALTSNVPLTASRFLLQDRAALTLNTGANQSLNYLSMAENTALNLRGSGRTYTVNGTGALSGTITVGSGVKLAFNGGADSRLGGTIASADTTSAISFTNASTTAPITYRAGNVLADFAGKVTVGSDTDKQGTTLSVDFTPEKGSYNVLSSGTLELMESSKFSPKITGTGTLRIGEGAQSVFELSANKPSYATTLALDVAGSLTIGSTTSLTVAKSAVARALTVSGDLTVYTGSGTSTYGSVTLNGGRYDVCLPFISSDWGNIIQNIGALTVGAKGGTFSATHQGSAFAGQYFRSNINNLSGSGDLTLAGSNFMGLSYFRLNSVDKAGYSGNITLRNDVSYTTSGNQVSLELGSCTLPGAIALNNIYDNSLCRVSLGITADASVGGLDSDGRGSAYLYSGALSDLGADMPAVSMESQIKAAAHTLTLNTAGSHSFAGKVLGTLHLVKDGSGTQLFTGDMSAWKGSLTVKNGTLAFANALTMSGKLTMSGGTLQAGKLVTSAGASFSGNNTLLADSVSDSAGWSFAVTLENADKAVLTLGSLNGSAGLSLSKLNISYDADTLVNGTYKLLQYNADFGGELKGVTISGDCLTTSIGTKDNADVYFTTATVGGKKVYTLVLDVDNARGTLPRSDAATLTWAPASGEWSVEKGHAEGAWTGSKNNNFYNGDTVIFNTAATVGISGAVNPAAVKVQNASGTVVWNAKDAAAAIAGKGTLTKSGAGALTINTANSYTGGTTLTAGTLTAGNAAAFGTGAVTVQGGTLAMGSQAVANAVTATGGTLTGTDYKGNLTVKGNVTLGSGFKAGRVTLQSGTLSGSLTNTAVAASGGTLAAQLSGTSSVTSSGTVTLSGNNTYTGGTTVNGGTLSAGSATAFGTGGITLSNGTLDLDRYAVANAINAKGGTLSGTAYQGALTVSNGTVTLDDGFRAGSLTLGGGTLVFGGESALAVAESVKIQSATHLDVSAYTESGAYTLISAGSFSGSLSNLSYVSSFKRAEYSLEQMGNDLMLHVRAVAANLRWVQPKGTLAMGCVVGADRLNDGDNIQFANACTVTLSGPLTLGDVDVRAAGKVSFTLDKKMPNGRFAGNTTLVKSGAGLLTLNAGNTYSGGTVLKAGTIKATAADSFGRGTITVNGGTLDLASKAVANNIVLAGAVALKGDAKYLGRVTVDGKATLLTKTSYKGLTTIGTGSTLTLGSAVKMAGSLDVRGTLNITDAKGLTIAKGMSLTLNGGTVKGLVNVGTGSVLNCSDGTLVTAPLLSGGTLITGGSGSLTLSGTGTLKLGTQAVSLKSKGAVLTDEDITVTGGKVTLTGVNRYNGNISVWGGTFALGNVASAAAIDVTGGAVFKNGSAHSGNINVAGQLLKGSVIKLVRAGQSVNLNHGGAMSGTISGVGIVNVNANIDASLGKMQNSVINLNSGRLTNAKGIKLANGQRLTFGGGHLNLAGKALTTSAGSTVKVSESGSLSGALTLGGGTLVLEDGTNLSVSGALTLSKATRLSVDGTASLTFGYLAAPKKGTLEDFFGVGAGITIARDGNTLTFSKLSTVACAVPETEEFEVVAAPAPETVTTPAPALAPAVAELAERAAAARPLGDALVMADWAIVDANRTFTTTLQSRRDSGVMLADGQGMAWVSAMGGVSRHGSGNGHNGADVNLNGAAVGVEHTAGANSTLGLAVGHTWSRIGATGMQHLRQDTAHVALYGNTKLPHGFTAEWAAAYGDTDSKGSFYGTRETWSQKSTALSARLNKTHELTDATAVRGFAGLSYDATDAASIHGMHTGSIQRLQGEVGAGITHRADKLTTYAEASVTTDLARNAPAVDFGAWRQGGATPGRTGLNLTLGAAYELTDKWSINAAYHVEAAERATQHTLNIGAGRKF